MGKDQPVFTFGKYQGVPLAEIPSGYLRWAMTELDLTPGLYGAIEDELVERGEEGK